MFTVKRNQVVVTALAVMIGTAGYLNFQESQSAEGVNGLNGTTAFELTEEGDITAVITDYNTVPDDVIAENITAKTLEMEDLALDAITAEVSVSDISDTTGDGTAIFVNADSLSTAVEFFAEAKLEREQARAKQKDILTEMLDNDNVSQDQKDECGNQLISIQEKIEKETASEAMIKSKGFTEAYVRIDDETVDVVVDKLDLSQAELAQIEDVVKRKTGFTAEQIRISSLK